MLPKENYSSQVLLHERAIEILDLRTRALKRLEEAQENVRHYDNASHLQRLGSFWSRSELEWQVKVKERSVSFLTGLYARHSAKICGTLAPVLSSPKHTTATPVEVPELQAGNSFGSGFGDFEDDLRAMTPFTGYTAIESPKNISWLDETLPMVSDEGREMMRSSIFNSPGNVMTYDLSKPIDYYVNKDDTYLVSHKSEPYDDHHTN